MKTSINLRISYPALALFCVPREPPSLHRRHLLPALCCLETVSLAGLSIVCSSYSRYGCVQLILRCPSGVGTDGTGIYAIMDYLELPRNARRGHLDVPYLCGARLKYSATSFESYPYDNGWTIGSVLNNPLSFSEIFNYYAHDRHQEAAVFLQKWLFLGSFQSFLPSLA